MASRQLIITTVFGPKAETIAKTFASFLKVPDAELHVFVYNQELPHNRHPQLQYHLVEAVSSRHILIAAPPKSSHVTMPLAE